MKRKDIQLGALIGLFIGIFVQSIAGNVRIGTVFFERIGIIVAATLLVPLGLFIAGILGKRFPILWRFGKFFAVGALNTSIDFGILNFLSHVSATYAGLRVGGYNVISSGTALLNSYVWNRQWVFEKGQSREKQEFLRFFGVSIAGLLINSTVVYSITTFLPPIGGISPSTWELVAKVPATFISLFWNFAGYKILVFRVRENRP